jgi:steroid delta-isomerase-like uncharacterized protein
MSSAENKQVVRRHLDLSWNKRDVEGLSEVWGEDAVIHFAGGVDVKGGAAIKKYLGGVVGAYSDRELILDEIVGNGGTVATRWTFHGTQTGETMGVPATNRRVTITGMDFYHVVEGKIVEEWIEFDALGMMRQMGALGQGE